MSDLLPLQTDPVGSRRQRPPFRRVGVVIVLLLLAGLAGGAFFGGRAVLASFGQLSDRTDPDYPGPGSGRVLVQVQEGDSATDIGRRLVDEDVVRSTGAFADAADGEPKSVGIQPGFYRMQSKMSAAGALAVLVDPTARIVSRVTLPEGTTVADAVARTAKGVRLPAKDLRAALKKPAALGLPAYAKGRPEGFLFPATYEVEPGTSPAGTLKLMVDRYRTAAQELRLEERAAAIGRTPYEVLITASLVEAETAFPGDRGKVARVVYNRLDEGMKLQYDSTVNYFLPERKGRLLKADIRIENPYNTYVNTGLPPTPIGAPGEASLEAALAPAEGDWVYFVKATKDGRSFFTSDYKAFINAKNKAQAEGVY